MELKKHIRALIIEDSEDDALLVVRELKQGGFDPEYLRVDSAEGLREALRSRAWDVILSDYRMPGFSGADALKTIKLHNADIPFIIISGTIGEDLAVAMMKAGAADYLLKDALGKLVPAVERELRDAAVRREKREKETALERSKVNLAEAQRIAHVGSWEHNPKTGDIFWSDELFRLLGLDPARDRADFGTFFSRVHPEDQPALKAAIDASLQKQQPFDREYRFLLPDGTARVIHARAALVPDAAGELSVLRGTAQDITERKLAEEKVRQSENKYRMLFETSADGIFILDLDGNFIDANRIAYTRLGYTREEFLSLHVSRLDPPEFAARVPERMKEVREHGAVFESAHLRKDGTVMPVEINSRLMEYEGRTVYISIVRDITGRKEAETKLRRSEEYVRNILDTVDEGFIVVDRDFRIVTANKAYCTQVHRPADAVIGMHCYEVSHLQERPCYESGEECAVMRAFETSEPEVAVHNHSNGDGTVIYAETKAYPLLDDAGNVTSVIETVSNITEKHLLEEERLRTQKLEAIGTLAGGIAHDFNNLLQGVFGYISMAKMTVDQRERSLAMLEQAEKALNLSVSLTTQLLTFSKGGKPVKGRIDLRPVIENAAKFALSGSRIDYRIDIDPKLKPVDADEGQIGQVIQNIVLNADQAMPLGGVIAIEARNVRAGDRDAPARLGPGEFVEIAIKDSGIGIPAEFLDKIFDPYFTTKEKGSGLGLATSYSIVRNHDGLIDVRSEIGKGSTFTIYLPAVEPKDHGDRSLLETPSEVRRGRILLMDDEEIVRMVATELITALGHEVDLAEQGAVAVEKYQQARDAGRPYDIVILDLTIRGGMGGLETLRLLRALDPAVKAVVSSGYSDEAVTSEYAAHGFRSFLKKPYDIDALKRTLNALLQ